MSAADQKVVKSFEVAKKALAELEKVGAPATPQNFEMWYAHLSGQNPKLSDDLTKVINKADISEDVTGELYDRHFANLEMSDSILQAASGVETEITDIVQVLEDTGRNTSAYGDALAGASGQLSHIEDTDAVRTLLDGILRATRAMETQNRKLEERLAESTREICTLRDSVEKVRSEALTDGLTGIANRKCFDETLRALMAEAESSGEEMCLIVTDIDHFKAFNDTWGHQTGDQVLRLVASTMNANVKGRDLLARYGGEEFVVVLPQTSLEHGVTLANTMRQAIEAKRLKKRSTNEDLGTVTVSLGIAKFRPGEKPQALIERADQCLYAAKRAGRNRALSEEDLAKIEAAA
ncbi:MAG: GGDEF domain-containing protein [Pseudomonadota bacterium]